MLYDVAFEVREDRAREWMDTLSDYFSEYYADISGARMTLEGLDITEVWGVLDVIADYLVPIRRLTVEERQRDVAMTAATRGRGFAVPDDRE